MPAPDFSDILFQAGLNVILSIGIVLDLAKVLGCDAADLIQG